MAKDQIAKIGWWHEAIVDWMILYPEKSLTECAKTFRVTLPWLSKVINSDCFIQYKAARMGEHQANLSTTVIEKVEGLAHGALDIIEQRMTNDPDSLTFSALKETAELSLKAMGYTARSPAAININAQGGAVQVNQHQASPEVLERARDNLRKVQEAFDAQRNDTGTVIEAVPTPA